jgi:hypothetical protein
MRHFCTWIALLRSWVPKPQLSLHLTIQPIRNHPSSTLNEQLQGHGENEDKEDGIPHQAPLANRRNLPITEGNCTCPCFNIRVEWLFTIAQQPNSISYLSPVSAPLGTERSCKWNWQTIDYAPYPSQSRFSSSFSTTRFLIRTIVNKHCAKMQEKEREKEVYFG